MDDAARAGAPCDAPASRQRPLAPVPRGFGNPDRGPRSNYACRDCPGPNTRSTVTSPASAFLPVSGSTTYTMRCPWLDTSRVPG
jgi:hypothetical protein